MADKRQRKIRLTYVERTPQQIESAICDAVYEGGVLWDYLSSVVADRVQGNNEFERGVAEGMRALANEILTIAMSKRKPLQVKVTQEE